MAVREVVYDGTPRISTSSPEISYTVRVDRVHGRTSSIQLVLTLSGSERETGVDIKFACIVIVMNSGDRVTDTAGMLKVQPYSPTANLDDAQKGILISWCALRSASRRTTDIVMDPGDGVSHTVLVDDLMVRASRANTPSPPWVSGSGLVAQAMSQRVSLAQLRKDRSQIACRPRCKNKFFVTESLCQRVGQDRRDVERQTSISPRSAKGCSGETCLAFQALHGSQSDHNPLSVAEEKAPCGFPGFNGA